MKNHFFKAVSFITVFCFLFSNLTITPLAYAKTTEQLRSIQPSESPATAKIAQDLTKEGGRASRGAAEGYITAKRHDLVRAFIGDCYRNNTLKRLPDLEGALLWSQEPIRIYAVPGLLDATGVPDHYGIRGRVVYVDQDLISILWISSDDKQLYAGHTLDELRKIIRYGREERHLSEEGLVRALEEGKIDTQVLVDIHREARPLPESIRDVIQNSAIDDNTNLKTARQLMSFLKGIKPDPKNEFNPYSPKAKDMAPEVATLYTALYRDEAVKTANMDFMVSDTYINERIKVRLDNFIKYYKLREKVMKDTEEKPSRGAADAQPVRTHDTIAAGEGVASHVPNERRLSVDLTLNRIMQADSGIERIIRSLTPAELRALRRLVELQIDANEIDRRILHEPGQTYASPETLAKWQEVRELANNRLDHIYRDGITSYSERSAVAPTLNLIMQADSGIEGIIRGLTPAELRALRDLVGSRLLEDKIDRRMGEPGRAYTSPKTIAKWREVISIIDRRFDYIVSAEVYDDTLAAGEGGNEDISPAQPAQVEDQAVNRAERIQKRIEQVRLALADTSWHINRLRGKLDTKIPDDRKEKIRAQIAHYELEYWELNSRINELEQILAQAQGTATGATDVQLAKGSDDSGSAKDLGPRTLQTAIDADELAKRKPEFEELAMNVTEEREPGVRVVEADLGTQGAYSFHSKGSSTAFASFSRPILIIVVNGRYSKEVQEQLIHNELLEHDLMKGGNYDEWFAHIIVSGREITNLKGDQLLPYHLAWLQGATTAQRQAIIDETEEDRQAHYEVLEAYNRHVWRTIDIPKVKQYETRLRAEAQRLNDGERARQVVAAEITPADEAQLTLIGLLSAPSSYQVGYPVDRTAFLFNATRTFELPEGSNHFVVHTALGDLYDQYYNGTTQIQNDEVATFCQRFFFTRTPAGRLAISLKPVAPATTPAGVVEPATEPVIPVTSPILSAVTINSLTAELASEEYRQTLSSALSGLAGREVQLRISVDILPNKANDIPQVDRLITALNNAGLKIAVTYIYLLDSAKGVEPVGENIVYLIGEKNIDKFNPYAPGQTRAVVVKDKVPLPNLHQAIFACLGLRNLTQEDVTAQNPRAQAVRSLYNALNPTSEITFDTLAQMISDLHTLDSLRDLLRQIVGNLPTPAAVSGEEVETLFRAVENAVGNI